MLANYVSSLRGLLAGGGVGQMANILFNSHGRILMLYFLWLLGLRFEKFFNNIFYCMPHGQNRTRDVLMHVTLTII